MNSKAIKRQLLAAIAMVLVAAIALGSSTYAWFVASGTVEAKGMKVQAQSEGGIAIRFGDGNWGTTATAGMTTATTLYPTSTHNLKQWSHATALEAQKKDADRTTYADISTQIMDGDTVKANNQFVVMKEFEIRSTSANDIASGLKVEDIAVTINNALPDVNMATALRVGIFLPKDQVTITDGDTKNPASTKIFGPTKMATNPDVTENKALSEYTVHYSNAENDAGQDVTLTQLGTEECTILPNTYKLPTTDITGVKVQIVIWFEGEDRGLYSDNFNASQFEISVKFSSLSGGKTAPTKISLNGVTVSTENTSAGGKTYYKLDGVNLGGKSVYIEGNTLSSASTIYTISGDTVTDVTGQFDRTTIS